MKFAKSQKWGILIVLSVLLVYYLFSLYQKKDIDNNRVRTVGQIYGLDGGQATTSPNLRYRYYIKEKRYTGIASFDGDYRNYENNFYQIDYSAENPNWSEILLTRPITDTVAIKAAGFSLPKSKKNQFQAN